MKLGEVLMKWRKMADLTVRDAAKDIGISAATFSRVERGFPTDGRTLAAILRWLMAGC